MSSPTQTQTILFLGATGGVARAVLRKSLAAGHTCIALCRTPSKLLSLLEADGGISSSLISTNLTIEQGNALNVDDLLRCLNISVPGPVNTIISSIGGYMQFSKMRNDDPHVNENGMKALLQALSRYRTEQNKTPSSSFAPKIISVSTTGVSEVSRRIPVLLIPLYATLLKQPAKDKTAMERQLVKSEEEKNWTIVRPSIFTDGPEVEDLEKSVTVGVEDPVEGKDVAVDGNGGGGAPFVAGYTISRLDVGRWIFENLVKKDEDKYRRKAVMISY